MMRTDQQPETPSSHDAKKAEEQKAKTAKEEEEKKQHDAKKAEEQKAKAAKEEEEKKQHDAKQAKEAEEKKQKDAKKAEEKKQKEAKEAEEKKAHDAKKAEEKKKHDAKKAAPASPEPEANDESEARDDELYEVDEDRHTLRLPMHIAGRFYHDLPEPEHEHFRPMSHSTHYSEHPFVRSQERFAHHAGMFLQ